MKASEILRFVGISQGTATKSEIRRVWFSLPFEGLGQREVLARFKRIGCNVEEEEND